LLRIGLVEKGAAVLENVRETFWRRVRGKIGRVVAMEAVWQVRDVRVRVRVMERSGNDILSASLCVG
jgi:hypothetical protein